MCHVHQNIIKQADKRYRNIRKLSPKDRAEATWTNPLDAAVRDATSQLLSSDVVVTDHETVAINFNDAHVGAQRLVTYARKPTDTSWSLEKNIVRDVPLPKTVHIVPEDYTPLRHAKTRTRFREHLLRKAHDRHKVLGNLLLFKCVTCKNRIVAFHPDHQPLEELTITRTYPNAVAEWHTKPDATRTKAASFNKKVDVSVAPTVSPKLRKIWPCKASRRSARKT